MFTNTVFRTAFALSFCVHVFAVSAGNFWRNTGTEDIKPEVELVYIIPEVDKPILPDKILESVPQKYDLKKDEIKNKYEQKIIPKAQNLASLEEALEIASQANELSKQDREDYIQYYELLREKIKKAVAIYCERSNDEGSVEIIFTLSKKGFLEKASIDDKKSVKSASLRQSALKGLKAAAPFPPFPKTLNAEELTFAIAIIFTKR